LTSEISECTRTWEETNSTTDKNYPKKTKFVIMTYDVYKVEVLFFHFHVFLIKCDDKIVMLAEKWRKKIESVISKQHTLKKISSILMNTVIF
jgi:hypothetical protein